MHAGKVDRELARLLSAMAGLAKRIRAELPVRRDPASTRNVYGEQQLELDVWMNDLFVDALRGSKLVAQVASEEMGEVKDVGRGRFSVVLDPLDGSSNVKSNNIFGTIFGIFDRKSLPARGSAWFSARRLIGQAYGARVPPSIGGSIAPESAAMRCCARTTENRREGLAWAGGE